MTSTILSMTPPLTAILLLTVHPPVDWRAAALGLCLTVVVLGAALWAMRRVRSMLE